MGMNGQLKDLSYRVSQILEPHMFEEISPERIKAIQESLTDHGINYTWSETNGHHSFTVQTALNGKSIDLTYKVTW